ncbi:MAG: hypothetical protein WAV78_08615, partial [Xanthobacteraceae bacterium]
MTMDEFSAPLGRHTRPRNRGLRISASRIAIGAGALAAVLATAWAITTDSPLRGRPDAIASAPEVTRAAANAPVTASGVEQSARQRNNPSDAAPEALAPPPATAMRTETIIDGMTGKRREIVLPETTNVI